MKKGFFQIVLWLCIVAVLTLLAMGVWLLFFGGSQTTESLKWLQFLQTIGTFLLPPVLCAWIWDENRKPFRWLGMTRSVDWKWYVWAVLIMVAAIPAINLLGDLNSRVELPESLDFIEQSLRQKEELAAQLTERFLQADSVAGMLINVGLLALLPALSEELTFRGTLQQIIGERREAGGERRKVHIAIWITAFIFSAVHMQFYGFVPRMLLGALFGYMFVWTGSLWVPVLMHFVNNGIAVVVYYLIDSQGLASDSKNWADTIGAGSTWWLGVLSLIVAVVLVITYPGRQEYVRRTRTQ